MSTIEHGDVRVTLSDDLPIPPRAGQLSPGEILRLPKAPRGIGGACDDAAEALAHAGPRFVPPEGVTPESLREAGRRAEAIDQVIASVEVVLARLKQANLLLDAEAWEQLRKLNDMVKSQGKTNPEVLTLFKPLTAYMARAAGRRQAAPAV